MTHTGTIKMIKPDRGFGFIKPADGPDVFFHCSDLDDLAFNEQLVERRVQFNIVTSPKGPRAVAIRAAD